MRILVLGSDRDYLVNFRGDLIRAMVAAGCEVFASAPAPEDGHHAARIREMGATFVPIEMARNSVSPLRDAATLRRLVRTFRRIRPDSVFAYTAKPVIYGGIAARLAGVRSFHALIPGLGYLFMGNGASGRARRALAARMYRAGLARAETVFFQNRDDAEDLREAGALRRGQQITYLAGSGIDTERFAPAPFPERAAFLFVARLVREKGIGEFIEAARMVKERIPDAVFRVVGYFDGSPNDIDRGIVDAAHREGTIEFVGRVSDVRPELARSSAFVLPSYYREGTPRSALEALAMGRPVVTTDWVGCRETVEDGVNGMLVPVRDPAAVARAVELLARDRGLLERMGRASRDRACSRFDVRSVNADIMAAMGVPRPCPGPAAPGRPSGTARQYTAT